MSAKLEDTVAALEATYHAMEVADRLVEEAMQEHARAFALQIREKIGAETMPLQEPYLASEMARFQLQFVKTMARLFAQAEKLLPDTRKEQEGKSGDFACQEPAIAASHGSRQEARAGDEIKYTEQGQLDTKAIDPRQPITPQMEERIAIESVRLSRRVKQSLDGKRQQAYGLRRYIWRSQDDDKVRTSHAANDGRVFDWDSPPPTGHPGEVYGCRCFAEPILSGAEEPLPEGVEMTALVNPITVEVTAEIIAIIANAADKVNKGRKLLQATRAADVLAQEIQQQEEEGARDAPQPPTSPTPQPEPPDDEEPPEGDKTPKEILNPDGEPIGEPGNGRRVRILNGGDKAARRLYKQLGRGGKSDTPPNYPGEGTRLPNGDWIGYRPSSKSKLPTVDVKVEGVDFTKIHFPE